MSIASHIKEVTVAGGSRTAIDFGSEQITWGGLGASIAELESLLDKPGNSEELVGLLGRNRTEPVAAFIAALGAGKPVLLINAVRSANQVAKEVEELRLACLLGTADDLVPEVLAAARRTGTQVLELSLQNEEIDYTERTPRGIGPFRTRGEGTLIEIQTSGTTGAPKRIPIAEHTIEASLRDGIRSARGTVEQPKLEPKTSPTLMFSPLVHTSGTFNTLMAVFEVRPIVLFEKFDPARFTEMLVRYRPRFVPLPPTAIKMMVDSPATREDFSSVTAVRAGTAPLAVELQDAFESKFGVPVLTTYGATEFMGVVTSWTLDDYRQFGKDKRGSVGRTSKGVEIRVVEADSGAEVARGEVGVLEARLQRIDGGKSWIRTTDIARIDEDGFLYVLGRSDDAIIRGGFKIMAGKVADLIRRYPGVNDAIVIGRRDERLGEVPVAVVEPSRADEEIDASALRLFAKEHLTPYEVPARIHVVPRLPRTVSDKISRVEVKAMLDALET
ncbi:class I adenylate-forming enzyme family protein [Paraburkholderia phytofirmans]|uniref:class I adenylate-forming enzyme family protein n=1 Tax=Paraburkholderia phytofirmans TaxID=261302 RepID=UPI0038B8397E